MKTSKLTFFLFLFLVGNFSFSCENDNIDPLDENVDFQFRLLNENGDTATTFNLGENIIFSFLIINNSGQRLVMQQRLDDQDNFFRVFKINENPTENDQEVIDMGKPWKTMFCEFVGGKFIDPQDTLKLEVPWITTDPWEEDPFFNPNFCLPENTSPLGTGKYRSGFSSAFYFSEGENSFNTETIRFDIEFEIID